MLNAWQQTSYGSCRSSLPLSLIFSEKLGLACLGLRAPASLQLRTHGNHSPSLPFACRIIGAYKGVQMTVSADVECKANA